MASVKTVPGLDDDVIREFALRAAKPFTRWITSVLRWLDGEDDLNGLSPRLLDQFARTTNPGLVNELQGTMIYGAFGAWSVSFNEIPGLEKILKQEFTATTGDVPSSAFKPKEGLKRFKKRVPVPKSVFNEMSANSKAQAWTMANWTSWNFLADMQTSIANAIEEGQSFSTWHNSVKERIRSEDFQQKVPGQLYTTFNNATLNTYNTERYKGMLAVTDSRPFWQILTVNDGSVRPEHQAYHGKIYLFDDPIWNWLMPQNGHNCRCYIVTKSQRQIDNQGLRVSTKGKRAWVDDSWRSNPATGKTSSETLSTYKKFDEIRMLGLSTYKKLPKNLNKPIATPELLPGRSALTKQGTSEGQATRLYNEQFKEELGITDKKITVMLADPLKNGVEISDNVFKTSHELDIDDDRLTPMIKSAVEDPEEIWLQPYEDENGRTKHRRRYLTFYENGKVMMLEEQNFQLYVPTFLTKVQANKQRDGAILYRRGVAID